MARMASVSRSDHALHSASVVSKGKRILAKDLPQSLSTVTPPADENLAKIEEKSFSETKEYHSSQSEGIRSSSQEMDASPPVFGETVTVTEDTSTTRKTDNTSPPSSISLDESFDFAYSHLRAKSDRNLIEEMEKEVIRRALQECGGNQVKASSLLGITRATLRKRIDSYQIRY